VTIFETFMGLPLHPLAIHAAVVAVPLLALAGIAYALVPRLRGRIGWVTVLLALAAPLTALVSKLSGDAFRARIEHKNLANPEIFAKIDNHRSLGTITLYLTIALAVAVLALVLLRNQPRAVSLVLAVVTVGLGLVSVWYVYRTGDAGAKIVWSGY
jgi:Na+/glutamate symporter